MKFPISNMATFVYNGSPQFVVAWNGNLWLWNGSTGTMIAGTSLNTTGYCVMEAANGLMYIIDASGNLYSTDGNTVTAVGLLDANNNPILGLQDMTWFMNTMFYVAGSFMYFSVVNAPTNIVTSAINVAIGDGGVLRRVFPYRNGLLVLFKYAPGGMGGPGSIHLCDVSSGQPSLYQLNTQPLFDHINLCSPRTVTRMGYDQNAEIVFGTIEGLRSDQFTALDRLVTPSLPFSQNLTDTVGSINPNALDSSFTVLWNDELLWFIPTGSNTTPDTVAGYQTKVPKENVLNGWTTMPDLMPATCATVASIAGTETALYLGTDTGELQEAFAQDTGATYKEISRRIDHGLPEAEKMGRKLIVFLAPDHKGNFTVTMLFDDGTSQVVGTYVQTGGVIFAVVFPVVFGPEQETNVAFDLHFNGLAGNYQRYKDTDIEIVSTSLPSILGWMLESVILPSRYSNLNDAIPASSLNSLPIASEATSPAAIAWG